MFYFDRKNIFIYGEVKKIGLLLYIKFRNQILERIKNRKGSRLTMEAGEGGRGWCRLQYHGSHSEQYEEPNMNNFEGPTINNIAWVPL